MLSLSISEISDRGNSTNSSKRATYLNLASYTRSSQVLEVLEFLGGPSLSSSRGASKRRSRSEGNTPPIISNAEHCWWGKLARGREGGIRIYIKAMGKKYHYTIIS